MLTPVMRALPAALIVIVSSPACGDGSVPDDPECRDPASGSDIGLPSCWIHDCPTDPGARICGSCVHPLRDEECPPGFVCSCVGKCTRGPRSYDGGSCLILDAGPGPDARTYEWPACDMRHAPCST